MRLSRVEGIFEIRKNVSGSLNIIVRWPERLVFRRHIVFLGQDQRSNRPRYRDQDKFGKPDYYRVFLFTLKNIQIDYL